MTRLFAILLGLLLCAGAQADTRVQAANLTYQGKFSVPTSEATCNGAGNTLGWMAPGMTYHPANDSLYLFGRDAQGSCVAEISTPAINGTATFLQSLNDCTNGHLGDIPGSGNAVIGGGLLVYNGKLWCNYFAYYDSGFQQTASLFSHGLTLSNHTGATGPAVIANGGTQAGYVSGYMAHVPAAWQAALGGPVVVGNCCLSVITRTSYGPALFGFNPESPGTSFPLVYYNSAHPTLGTFGEEGPPANTAFSPTTKVTDGLASAGFNTATSDWIPPCARKRLIRRCTAEADSPTSAPMRSALCWQSCCKRCRMWRSKSSSSGGRAVGAVGMRRSVEARLRLGRVPTGRHAAMRRGRGTDRGQPAGAVATLLAPCRLLSPHLRPPPSGRWPRKRCTQPWCPIPLPVRFSRRSARR